MSTNTFFTEFKQFKDAAIDMWSCAVESPYWSEYEDPEEVDENYYWES